MIYFRIDLIIPAKYENSLLIKKKNILTNAVLIKALISQWIEPLDLKETFGQK